MTHTVGALVDEARRRGIDRLDAHLLLAHRLRRPREWLIAHDDAAVAPDAATGFLCDLERRGAGVPLAYLTGTKDFRSLPLHVTPDVLVPRPETETLVDWAIELLSAVDLAGKSHPDVLDLGTGSGAIALALKSARPAARVTATDASPAALEVARRNATALGLDVEFVAGHWFAPLAGRRFDLVVSNPPYVAPGDPHLAALHAEPTGALVAGADGFEALREIVGAAPRHLRAGGWVVLEHGATQGDAVARMLVQAHFEAVTTRPDLAGLPRCTGGRRPDSRMPGGA